MSEVNRALKSTSDRGPGDAAAVPESREKESGRVAFDARGNPVWEWRTGEETFQRDASTSLVRKLESPDLSLEATAIARPQGGGGAAQKGAPSCGGFDPYDSGATSATSPRTVSRPAPVRAPVQPAAGPSHSEPGLLRKLQAWMGGRGS